MLFIRRGTGYRLTQQRRQQLLASPDVRQRYYEEFVSLTGAKSYLGSISVYPHLKGLKANLYKCFITLAWEVGSTEGVAGFLHPEGVFDDPSGGELRQELYPRLRYHFHFRNELILFADVAHTRHYGIHIYRARPLSSISITYMSGLFHPATISDSMVHDGLGATPGIKTDDGKWNLLPHRNRIIVINEDRLALFATLFDELGTKPQQARLPSVHSREVVSVLEKLSSTPRKLAHLGDDFFISEHWNEVYAQQDGTITRKTVYPASPQEWVLSGPHIYIATPFFKTPNEVCEHNLDYSDIDLTTIPDNYLPRTNYIPGCSIADYRRRSQHWRDKPIVDYYRHAHREMLAVLGERTLIPAIIPPGAGHLYTVISICFSNLRDLLTYNSLAGSLVIDFFVKVSGVGHANTNLASSLPLPEVNKQVTSWLHARALRLNCLTTSFRELWENAWLAEISSDSFAKVDNRLGLWNHLLPAWSVTSALRTDFERRQALVEIDALAAIALGLTEEELITIFRRANAC